MSQSRSARRNPSHRAAVRLGAVAAALVSTVALAGCGGGTGGSGGADTSGGSGSSAGSGTKFVEGTGQITSVAPADRKDAPDISGRTVQDEPLSLDDYEGKVVVLNVWGSWCAPCRAEAKHLVKVARDTEDQGVQFVGINTRDLDTANAEAFERRYQVGYPSLYDPSGKLVLRFKDSLPPQAIPSTLVIDRDGRIAVRALKELSEDELRKALDPVIAEKPSGGSGGSDGADTSGGSGES